MLTRLLAFLLVGLLLVAAAVACEDGEEEGPPEAATPGAAEPSPSAQVVEEVTIGLVTALTGETAELGVQLRDAAEFAVAEINAAGGIQALGGAEIRLVIEDSGGVPENAVAAFNRLVDEEGVVAVIGALTTPNTLAMGQQAERLGVPVVTDTPSGDALVSGELHYLVRLSPGAAMEAETMISAMAGPIAEAMGKDITRVAWLGWDGTAMVDDAIAASRGILEERGIELVDVVRFTEGQTSYSSEVAKIKAADVDGVLFCVLGIQEAVTIVREYKQQGLDPLTTPLVNCGVSISDPTFPDAAGELKDGLYVNQFWSPQMAGADTAFWERFGVATGFEVYDLAAFEVQAVYVVKAAMERCACVEHEGINDALHSLVMESDDPDFVLEPQDGVEFDETGNNPRGFIGVAQWQGDSLDLIWPPETAVAEPKVSP